MSSSTIQTAEKKYIDWREVVKQVKSHGEVAYIYVPTKHFNAFIGLFPQKVVRASDFMSDYEYCVQGAKGVTPYILQTCDSVLYDVCISRHCYDRGNGKILTEEWNDLPTLQTADEVRALIALHKFCEPDRREPSQWLATEMLAVRVDGDSPLFQDHEEIDLLESIYIADIYGAIVTHDFSDWIVTWDADTKRTTSVRKSAAAPTVGAEPECTCTAIYLLGTGHMDACPYFMYKQRKA